MRIVYSTESVTRNGGIQTVTIIKANALAEIEGNEVFIIVPHINGESPRKISPKVHLINLDIKEYWVSVWKQPARNRTYKRLLQNELEKIGPDIVISTGVAGGASTELEVTDVVVGTDYVYHDVYCGKEVEYGRMVGMPPRFVADDTLLAKARALQTETRIHTGRIVSGDWFVDSKEKMRSILHHFPDAMAVDMESASIAQTCFLHGVPFVSFRIISDIPLKDTDAAQYWDFWQRIANGSFEVTRQYLEML